MQVQVDTPIWRRNKQVVQARKSEEDTTIIHHSNLPLLLPSVTVAVAVAAVAAAAAAVVAAALASFAADFYLSQTSSLCMLCLASKTD